MREDIIQTKNEAKSCCTLGDPEKALEKTGAKDKNDCTVFMPKRVMDDRCCANCVHCE